MMPTDNRPCTCHPDDAPPAPCARRYALAECRDIQANVMDRAQSWLNAADERGINVTDENGYLAVIRDMMLEVVRLNERIAYLEPIFIAARNLTDNAERDQWETTATNLLKRAERAEAERDALRECVRAADGLRAECDQVPPMVQQRNVLHAYDAARAKVKV